MRRQIQGIFLPEPRNTMQSYLTDALFIKDAMAPRPLLCSAEPGPVGETGVPVSPSAYKGGHFCLSSALSPPREKNWDYITH